MRHRAKNRKFTLCSLTVSITALNRVGCSTQHSSIASFGSETVCGERNWELIVSESGDQEVRIAVQELYDRYQCATRVLVERKSHYLGPGKLEREKILAQVKKKIETEFSQCLIKDDQLSCEMRRMDALRYEAVLRGPSTEDVQSVQKLINEFFELKALIQVYPEYVLPLDLARLLASDFENCGKDISACTEQFFAK